MVDQLPWLSKCVRPMLRASAGHRYIGADLTNIEGRVNAWQAGEQWKLTAFTMADYGLGPGIYETTAAGIVGIPIEQVSKAQRQAQGKIPELACGYQGSVGAFVSMAANYNTKPEEVADVAAQTCPPELWAKTLAKFRPNMASGLEPHIWTGIKVVVDGWRARHPAIVQSWWDHQDAGVAAVSTPGMVVDCGKVRYLCTKGFLFCQVPNGESMSYPTPRVIRQKRERLTPTDFHIADPTITRWPRDDGSDYVRVGDRWYVEEEVWSNVVEVWGLIKGQWVPYTLYGGLQCENVCQRIARDVHEAAMKRISYRVVTRDNRDIVPVELVKPYFVEDRPWPAPWVQVYPIVLHAHDEVLCESPIGFGTKEELAGLYAEHTSWTTGLPLAAKGWEDTRYVK